MPNFTSPAMIIATLRKQLKEKGYHYHDVATRMGVSQGTVKRYLAGKGVTIDILQELAEIIGLDIFSLAATAQQENIVLPELTKTQQKALGQDQLLRIAFFSLRRGWTAVQIAREFELSPQRMEAVLARLQTLGLIRRLSTHGVEFLARPNYEKRRENELAGLNLETGHQVLREINLRDPNCEWASSAGRLSPASAIRLKKMMKKFVNDFLELDRSDLDLPPDQVQWYRLFIGAQPVSRKKLFRPG